MKRLIVAAAIFALSLPARADLAPAIHYAPAENLEHIDVTLIDTAKHEIDMAAYVLTDWPVMQALTRAADRGEGTPNRIVVTLASWRRVWLERPLLTRVRDAAPCRALARTGAVDSLSSFVHDQLWRKTALPAAGWRSKRSNRSVSSFVCSRLREYRAPSRSDILTI